MGSEDFEACDCVRTLRLRTSGVSFQGQGQYTIRALLFFGAASGAGGVSNYSGFKFSHTINPKLSTDPDHSCNYTEPNLHRLGTREPEKPQTIWPPTIEKP